MLFAGLFSTHNIKVFKQAKLQLKSDLSIESISKCCRYLEQNLAKSRPIVPLNQGMSLSRELVRNNKRIANDYEQVQMTTTQMQTQTLGDAKVEEEGQMFEPQELKMRAS